MRSSDAQQALDALRQELGRYGTVLPSLRIEQVWSGDELVHLGGVRPDVVGRLVAALRNIDSGSEHWRHSG